MFMDLLTRSTFFTKNELHWGTNLNFFFFAWEVRPVLRYIEVTEFEYVIRFFLARHVFLQFTIMSTRFRLQ